MALIVEDGTAKQDAESYASVSFANTYFTALNNASWTGADTVKEAALRKATSYIDSNYDFAGYKRTKEQALQWPRSWVEVDGYAIESDLVPLAVQRATAELALKSLTTTLEPDIERAKTRTKVDVIEVEYSEYSSQKTKFDAVDNLLRKYLMLGSNGVTRQAYRA
jgi:hypothetical protein